jgi:hypothetical protein
VSFLSTSLSALPLRQSAPSHIGPLASLLKTAKITNQVIFALKMKPAMSTEMLDNSQHSTLLNHENEYFTLNSSRENLRTVISFLNKNIRQHTIFKSINYLINSVNVYNMSTVRPSTGTLNELLSREN